MRGKNILVTGGAGFIGSHLTDALAKDNEVTVLDKLSAGRKENLEVAGDIDLVIGDVADTELVSSLSRNKDIIFHLAAIPNISRCQEDPVGTAKVNILGTLNVLEAARKAGARVVFASSSAVYGDPAAIPISETSPLLPISNYGTMKMACDRFCAIYGKDMSCVSLRFFNVYGPRQDPSSPYSGVISLFISHLLSSRPMTIFGDGEQTRDLIFVGDVVRAIILAAEKENVGAAINIGTGKATTINELAHVIADAMEVDANIVHSAPRPGDIRDSVADVSLAKKLLGFEAERGLGSGIKETVAYIRSWVDRDVGVKGR
ncbi:MAG: NAD-dependent epimerase/dehydratase family protein [Thermoplasmata archaeon]|nr:NAD-dependent epimerase/dehydratase family protein [Thermoplasmata archaeon]